MNLNAPVPIGSTPRFGFRVSAFSGIMNQKRQFSTMRVGFLVMIRRRVSSIFSALSQMSGGSGRKLFETGLVVDMIRLRLQTASSTRKGLPSWNFTPWRSVTIVTLLVGVSQLVASRGIALPVLSYLTRVS